MASKSRPLFNLSFLNVLFSGMLIISFLSGCGNNGTQTESKKEDASDSSDETKTSSKTAAGDEDTASDDDLMGNSKNKQPPKPALSVEPKKTGQEVDGYIVHQQNEFLGPTVLKIAKPGIRLESSTLTVVFPAGKEAIAFNPQNGNCMALTARSAAMMAGTAKAKGEQQKDRTSKIGTEKIAGIKCIHYELTREFIDKKTKKPIDSFSTEIWATKDLKLPPQIMKDCAKMTMMPPELGIPVRVIRQAATTKAESIKGEKLPRKKRDVISTSKCEIVKLDTGEFVPPSGFKTVTDEMKLMMTE